MNIIHHYPFLFYTGFGYCWLVLGILQAGLLKRAGIDIDPRDPAIVLAVLFWPILGIFLLIVFSLSWVWDLTQTGVKDADIK